MKEIETVEIRQLETGDYQELKKSMIEAYAAWPGAYWNEHHILSLLRAFPEGQIAVVVDGEVVGCALSIIVNYAHYGDEHTYQEITGNYTFKTHSAKGDTLYGVDVFIRPEFRGLRLGRRLYDARKELCETLNLKAIVFGGRIPTYHQHADKMSPKEFIQKVRMKELYDPTLTFQLANDFHVKKILKGYMPGDKESQEFAVLMEWDNIYFSGKKDPYGLHKSVVRLGLIQWQMRNYRNADELMEQAEFFVDAVSDYKSDFALFPELFNAPLMAQYNHLSEPEAIRKLSAYTEELVDRFAALAISYNVNIITGSMPMLKEEKLFNVGWLCRRDGSREMYEKIHITPDERRFWGITGGNKIKVIDTDCGPVGVLICYDIEFPEVSRLLAKQGVNIIFVPFLTDTQNGYSRVRACAQARAIENECYVAIAGAVGNLPKVHNMDIQFAQSVVFTPSDFAFPTNGIKAEATPNTEMILVVDVDMNMLNELHTYGSVRNLKDRRTDLYEVRFLE
jgi:predicted amidohydrolase/GNAT superfamily N-acetyltransferase